jgi:hypothetical protein
MKIHDLLRQLLPPGAVLTYEDIKMQVLAAYPQVNPNSIVPSEHMRGRRGSCKLCHPLPIFEKLERGLYRVLPGEPAPPQLSVHDKLVHVFQSRSHQLLTVAEIRLLVAADFPDTHLPSVIPLDHTLGGACRWCQAGPLLERTGRRGLYRVLLPPSQALPPMVDDTGLSEGQKESLLALLQTYQADLMRFQLVPFEQALDALPEFGYREKKLLLTALRERVLVDLAEFGPLLDTQVLHTQLAQRLYAHHGISLDLAHWAVMIWQYLLHRLQKGYAPSFVIPYRVAEPPESHAYYTSMGEVVLQNLQLIPLNPAAYWLKKRRHRVAWVQASTTAGYYLALRTPFYKMALVPQLLPYACSRPELPLAPERDYQWFQFSQSPDLITAILRVDTFLGVGSAGNEPGVGPD